MTFTFPRDKKFTKLYEEYLGGLVAYLRGFHARVKPLTFLDTVMRKAEEEFAHSWAEGSIPGWEDKGIVAAKLDSGVVDLDAFETVSLFSFSCGQLD